MSDYPVEISSAAVDAGVRAENTVVEALKVLPAPWQFFHTVEWRYLHSQGEAVGEADVVVFHPSYGLVVFEIKAGAVSIRNGIWYYGSGGAMTNNPFQQARRNRYALSKKLKTKLSKDTVESLSITHAAWFPELIWQGPVPNTDVPSRVFLFDRQNLSDPETALIRLFREAAPNAKPWTRAQAHVLKELLAPDCQQDVPLVARIDMVNEQINQATVRQLEALRLLRSQSRLLIEGGAGSGKTVLASMLAREHAAIGKKVLLTCFNKFLAQKLEQSFKEIAGVTVCHFHELVRRKALEAGLPYVVPLNVEAQVGFFRETSIELLLQATDYGVELFDSIIVDEGADFAPTWWLALEALGSPGFSWYCLYDTHQSLFSHGQTWEPPFVAQPFVLDENLRNTQPIGELATTLGQCEPPAKYRVAEGVAPIVFESRDFNEMAGQLRESLRGLIRKQGVKPEQIVVLSPYRHTNPISLWASGLSEVDVTTDVACPPEGHVRVGTIQGFKGLEADVVLLLGLDTKAASHPEWLYVGATRATGLLQLFSLTGSLPT